MLNPLLPTLFSVPPLRSLLCFRGPRRSGKVAITFDDGPNEHTTPQVLEILRAAQIRCTFFVLGREAVQHPDILHAIADDGHEVGLHGYDHTDRNFPVQIRRCEDEIGRHVAFAKLFRPAMGRRGLRHLPWLRVRGYATVLWSFDAYDSMRHEKKPAAMPDYARIQPGDIILMHDDNPVCATELPAVIRGVKERDMGIVTVSALLGRSP